MAKITVYGLSGTGKGVVSRLVAGRLNYEYFGAGDMMRKIAKDQGITLAELKEKRKIDPSYDRMLDESIKEFGKTHDKFVFESRLPWHFIPDSFKIKLTCNLDARMKRVAVRDKIEFEEAKKMNLYREKTDEDLFRKLYGIDDMNADEHFDLIIDTTGLTVEEIAEKIIKAYP